MFHKLSRAIVDYSKITNIGTIVIGYNERWKQNANLGRKNNQKFRSGAVLGSREENNLQRNLARIAVRLQTSHIHQKCSSRPRADRKTKCIRGKKNLARIVPKRKGTIINADVNASYNIIEKSSPELDIRRRDRGCRATIQCSLYIIEYKKKIILFIKLASFLRLKF